MSSDELAALRRLMPACEVAEITGRPVDSIQSALSVIKRKTGEEWPKFPHRGIDSVYMRHQRLARSIIEHEGDAWNGA